MSDVMTYKGFSARIQFDAEDAILTGRIAGINDVIGFHAEDAAGIATAFHDAVDDYINACAKIGKKPEKAFSGNMMVRIDPALHARIALRSEVTGTSSNQLVEEALAGAFGD